MEQNVVVLSFAEESKAYQALSELKGAAAQQRVQVQSAAVVQRDAQGVLKIKDGASDDSLAATPLTGSLIGALVGLFMGPLGMLLGTASGALIGGAVAADKVHDRLSVLDQLMQAIPAGSTALIATVDEVAVEVVNGLAATLGGSVLRRPLVAVQAEVEAQTEAQLAAAKEARRVLREKQGDEWRDKFDNWKEELGDSFDKLKSKLGQTFSSDKKTS